MGAARAKTQSVSRINRMQRQMFPHFIASSSFVSLGLTSMLSATLFITPVIDGPSGAPRGSVTPQAYGAKGDGVTDDTAAFQSALAAGDLVVPAATYLINGNIYVPSYRNVQCQPGAN